MNHSSTEEHGPSLCVARNDAGGVAICGCGVVTLSLQYLSLRFEPDAFRSLAELVMQAQHRLARCERLASTRPATDADDEEALASLVVPMH